MSEKKRSKKRERIPVIDTLLDLVGAMVLGYFAAKRRQKYGTKRSKKIDPYAATGAAIGMGRIKNTDDLIKFGGILGAMGAFDPDDDLPIDAAAYMTPRDNRYAWRLNCEDGSAYGVDPNDYETRDEYNNALNKEKIGWHDCCENDSDYGISPEHYETEKEYDEAIENAKVDSFDVDVDDEMIVTDDLSENAVDGAFSECSSKRDSNPIAKHDPYAADDFHVYVYCLVMMDGTNTKKYYRTEDRTLKRGEAVFVPNENSGGKLRGTICSVEHHMSFSVPTPVEETPEIIGRV